MQYMHWNSRNIRPMNGYPARSCKIAEHPTTSKKKKKKDIKIAARRTARSPTTPSCVETPPANRGASSPPSCICPGHLFCHYALRFPRNRRTSSRTYVHLSTGSDGNLSTLFPVTAAVEYLTESGTRREKTTVAQSDLLFRRSD